MKTFYIADLHFGHKNVLSYDNRPFSSIESHDQTLISRWNRRVSGEDEVWILGDVSWKSPDETVKILSSLAGNKKLVVGNHDNKLLRDKNFRKQFSEIVDYKEIYLPDRTGIVLCHYPIPCFKNHYYGWIHLYGHVHNSFESRMMEHIKYEMGALYDKPCRMINVGCMMPYMGYEPKTLYELIESCEKGG